MAARLRAAGFPEERVQGAMLAHAANLHIETPPEPGVIPDGSVATLTSKGKERLKELTEATADSAECICYVCLQPARKADAQYCCNGVYRHIGCDPSARERAVAAQEKEDRDMATKKKAGNVVVAKDAKVRKTPKAPVAPHPERKSLLDCAFEVLSAAKKEMSAKEMVAAVIEKKVWESKGKTPDATLYAAIIREIAAKGAQSRFAKTGPGHFKSA